MKIWFITNAHDGGQSEILREKFKKLGISPVEVNPFSINRGIVPFKMGVAPCIILEHNGQVLERKNFRIAQEGVQTPDETEKRLIEVAILYYQELSIALEVEKDMVFKKKYDYLVEKKQKKIDSLSYRISSLGMRLEELSG